MIGGGVNGCAIARDLAGRGLSVMLVEKDDLASATSSASTKLIHGGLRYLEHYEFRLVREALQEREVLLKAAPHIIWPLTFILPHHKKLRPWLMIRLGLFLYDYLGGRKILEKSHGKFLTGTLAGAPLTLVGLQLMFGRDDPWVPRVVRERSLDRRRAGRLFARIAPTLRRMERFLRPRLPRLLGPTHLRLVGAGCVALSVSMIVP